MVDGQVQKVALLVLTFFSRRAFDVIKSILGILSNIISRFKEKLRDSKSDQKHLVAVTAAQGSSCRLPWPVGRPKAKRHGSALVAASHPGHFEYRLGRLGTTCYLGVQLRLQMSISMVSYNLRKLGYGAPIGP